jgi:predicted RNA binding protein YcfA (HicA-like mRNA interferase family)
MKTRQFVKRLKAAGCRFVRHGGDHDIWYSPITGRTDEVPRHGSHEVKKGLLKSLEKTLLGL